VEALQEGRSVHQEEDHREDHREDPLDHQEEDRQHLFPLRQLLGVEEETTN
jgi:hypothetical protein